MSSVKILNGCHISPETKIFALLESKNVADHKKAKRLSDYCNKAAAVFCEYKEIQRLRNEYKDVL